MEQQIKKQIVEVSKLMYHKGLVNAYEGNVSVKFEDRVYVTPSAICKGILTEDLIIVTDTNGIVIEGKGKPSSELKLHLATYKYRSNVVAVIHTHSPYATAYAVANKPIETKAYPEMICLYEKIPLAEYGTPSTDEVHQGVFKYLNDYNIILLANHGIMAVGKDVYEAFYRLEAAESMAKVLFIAKQLGGEKELPPNKLNELYEMRKKMK